MRGRFRTAFVGEGLKTEGVPLADATKLAMIETFQFCISEIARAYGAPAALLDENRRTDFGQFSGSHARVRVHITAAILPAEWPMTHPQVVNDCAWRVEYDLANLLQSPSEQQTQLSRS